MKKTFNIDMFDGHLIFIAGGLKILVDTGCPVTIGKEKSFMFMGEEYVCCTSFGGRDINSVSQMMKYDIDVLMGMDIIEKYYVQTDYKLQQVTFSNEPLPVEKMFSTPIVRGRMGEVCINLTVKGNTVKLALDTGAKISYIDQSYTEGENYIETKDDFSPLIGHFQTPIYAMETSIDTCSFPVNFGVLPQLLAMPLQMMGIQGAIGFDLFNAFTVVLDFNNNMLYMR
jgi:hypothetical protein